MNEQSTKLLEQLANKLGTTSEYLWGILIKQAPIDSTITLVQFALIAIYGIILYRLHIKFSKETEDENSIYENDGVIQGIMVIGFIIFAILTICAFFGIPSVFNGYVNPEYWALREVLNSIQ